MSKSVCSFTLHFLDSCNLIIFFLQKPLQVCEKKKLELCVQVIISVMTSYKKVPSLAFSNLLSQQEKHYNYSVERNEQVLLLSS